MLPSAFVRGLCEDACSTYQDTRDDLGIRDKAFCQERWKALMRRGGWRELSRICNTCAFQYPGIQTEACMLLLSDSGFCHGCYREPKQKPYPPTLLKPTFSGRTIVSWFLLRTNYGNIGLASLLAERPRAPGSSPGNFHP